MTEADEIRAALLDMPDDVAEAFEAMKLAILRHRLSGWRDFCKPDMLIIIGLLAAIATSDESTNPGYAGEELA